MSPSAALQDSHVPPIDSVTVESPLPGGVAQVVRFLLNTVPPWLQIAGAVLAVLVAIGITWYLLRHRSAIIGWVRSRSTPVRIGLIGALVLGFVAFAAAGAATWNYTQHSNDFCTGCHVMEPAYERMAGGQTEHSKLSCHSCHQQPISASMWQLYLWVKERPQEIQKHAVVPNDVCATCHITPDTAQWQRIASTAGHRVHLESDSSVLEDMQCVECHGVEVHQFQPVQNTCGQSACHKPADTEIVLSKMAGQTVRHCTTCHQFTADVPALATTDSARGTLVPGQGQCLGCHEMRRVLADFDPKKDPHGGKCGMCHNPHTQETPREAALTCTTAGCHSNWRAEPFHVGETHRGMGERCLTCHLPHAAKVDASECEGCHRSIRARSRLAPPLPFDTAAALRRSHAPTERPFIELVLFQTPRLGVGPPPPEEAAVDSFSHSRHEKLACLVCHETGEGHGRLTFNPPRGCQICHHQAPARANCARCHQRSEYSGPQPATATVDVAGHAPKPRTVEFRHETHARRTCIECHTTPVSLAPAPPKATCRDCHDDHHEVNRTCTACHSQVQPRDFHKTLETAHQRCDACHTAATVSRLTPTRTFCSTCHAEKARNHYEPRECTTCHFLSEPANYRSRLLSQANR